MADVSLTYFADAKDAEKEIVRLGKQLEKMQAKNKAAGRESRRAAKDTAKGFDAASQSVGRFVGNLSGISGPMGLLLAGIRQVGQEFEKIQNRQNLAGQRQVELAPLQALAVQNLGAAEFGSDELIKRLSEMSRRTGVDERVITAAASEALSARGNNTAETALKAVEAAVKFNRFSPDDAKAFSGGALALQKPFGVTAEESIGFLSDVATKTRLTQIGDVASNAAPAIAGISQMGGSARESAALFSALTQFTEDETGDQARTTSLQLAKALRDRINADTGFENATTALERLRILQSDPELARKFMAGGEFGGQQFGKPALGKGSATPTIEALVGYPGADPEIATKVRDTFDEYLKTIPELGPAGSQIFQDKLKMISELPSAQIAETQQQFVNAKDAIFAQDPNLAMQGALREGLTTILQSIPSSALNDKIAMKEFEARRLFNNERPIDSALAVLERQKQQMEHPIVGGYNTMLGGFLGAAGFGIGTRVERTPTAEEAASAAQITELMRRLVELNERQLAAEERRNAQKPRVNRNANDEPQ